MTAMAAKLVQGGLISPPSACLTAMAAKLREQRSGLLAAAAAHGATRLARVTTAFSTRPGWHDWGVGIAYAVAQRADCTRRRVGAVVFDEANRILATGYNGAPAGRVGCLEGGCPRGSLGHDELPPDAPYEDPASPGFCISIHAESNALLFADPVRRRGGWIAITHPTCPGCQKLLANSGLATAIWRADSGALVEWPIGDPMPPR